jgi:hypothetical protein
MAFINRFYEAETVEFGILQPEYVEPVQEEKTRKPIQKPEKPVYERPVNVLIGIQSFPIEIIQLIMSYLPLYDQCSLSKCSRFMYNMTIRKFVHQVFFSKDNQQVDFYTSEKFLKFTTAPLSNFKILLANYIRHLSIYGCMFLNNF